MSASEKAILKNNFYYFWYFEKYQYLRLEYVFVCIWQVDRTIPLN